MTELWIDNNVDENLKILKDRPYIKLKIHTSLFGNDQVYNENVEYIESKG